MKAVLALAALLPLFPGDKPVWHVNIHATTFWPEGGNRGAYGKLRRGMVAAALPSRTAGGRIIEVRYKDRVVLVPVLDVGPWSTNDSYWRRGARPEAEYGRSNKYPHTHNPAGIDLTPATWKALGVKRKSYRTFSGKVDWRFLPHPAKI